MEATKPNVAIIVDLDEYGRICDFNLDFHNNVEVCDQNDPSKTKLGLELGVKTLTKNLSCRNCNDVINFNMIVRTARARRRNKHKRKVNSDPIEAQLEQLKKMQRTESDEVVEEIVEYNTEPLEKLPQIGKEEVIMGEKEEATLVYQCPINECNQLFESENSWQKHYFTEHQEGTSETNPIRVTITRTMEEGQEDRTSEEVEVVVENNGKCSSCKEPLEGQSNDLCYFCQYQRNQTPSNVESLVFACNLCSNFFVNQVQLDEHIKTRHPIFRCPVCSVYFRTRNALADHMRETCGKKMLSQ